jgi:hypothetical protein
MAWNRNDCIQQEATITFEIDGSCTSIEYLNDLIKTNSGKISGNTFLIGDLYNQLLDLNKVVTYLSKTTTKPCYDLCINPKSTQVLALKPVENYKKPTPKSVIKKVVDCKPVIVNKSKMIWTNPLASVSKGEIPILGVGNFFKKGDRLVNQHGKDLSELLPVHFGKGVGDLVYMGIVDYKWIGDRTTVYEEFMLEYQVYDIRTTVTSIYPAGIFQWQKWADNKISLIG